MPDNRELAIIMWLVAGLVFILARRGIRSQLFGVLRLLLNPKLAIPILVLVAWSVALARLGSYLRIWDTALVTETLIWFFLTAFVLLVNSSDAHEQGFFRRAVLGTLEASILVEFFVNIFVFSLAVELILVLVVFLLAALTAVAASEERFRALQSILNGAAATLGISLVAYVAVRALVDWNDLDGGGLARELALPIWMTIGVLPLVFVLGLYSSYELAFMRIDFATTDRWARFRAKVVLFWSISVRLGDVGRFVGIWPGRLARSSSFRGAREVMSEFLRSSATTLDP